MAFGQVSGGVGGTPHPSPQALTHLEEAEQHGHSTDVGWGPRGQDGRPLGGSPGPPHPFSLQCRGQATGMGAEAGDMGETQSSPPGTSLVH